MKIQQAVRENFAVQLLLNLALLPLGAVFYPIGAWFAMLILPIVHAALTYMNAKFAANNKKLLILQLVMLAATELGISCNSLLYFWRICYDYEGVLVAQWEAGVAAPVVIALSVTALVRRKFVWNKGVNRNQ